MKKLITLTFLLSLSILGSSCGLPLIGKHVVRKSGSDRLYASTDSAFKSYVAEFEFHGKQITQNGSFSVGDIPINFHTPSEDEYQGVCYLYSDDSREIIVRRAWWDMATEDDRRSLIFHELGHCKLDRDHDNSTEVIGGANVKLSMMNAYIVTGKDYTDHQDAYHYELFKKNNALVLQSYGVGGE